MFIIFYLIFEQPSQNILKKTKWTVTFSDKLQHIKNLIIKMVYMKQNQLCPDEENHRKRTKNHDTSSADQAG